jgi:hypothetical protein
LLLIARRDVGFRYVNRHGARRCGHGHACCIASIDDRALKIFQRKGTKQIGNLD